MPLRTKPQNWSGNINTLKQHPSLVRRIDIQSI